MPPKEKYVLLLDIVQGPLVFVVNSRIHPFISSRPHLVSCQLELVEARYPYLKHDSYLDCSNAIEDMTEDEIVGQLMRDTSRIKALLVDADRVKLKTIVAGARTVSARNKSIIDGNF